MKRLFISTTNNIDNGKAIEYYGVVSSHIVAGTGFFTDFAASVSDILGTRSSSYRRELESLYDEALNELSEKAQRLGANGILGLKIDMDNISGKGMSMFMITAVGTAAKIKFDKDELVCGPSESITSSVLLNEIAKREVLLRLEDEKTFFMQRDWEQILKNPDKDFILPLCRKFFHISIQQDLQYRESFQKNLSQLIRMTNPEYAIQGLYEGLRLEKGFDSARLLIKEYSLFDAKSLLEMIREGFTKSAIAVLGIEKPQYSEADLHDMESLLDTLENLPDIGKKEIVTGMMFSKDGEKYICSHGHKNNPDVEYCGSCGENIKGLNRNEVKAIETFKNRVAVLRELLIG